MSGYLFFWMVPVAIIAAIVAAVVAIVFYAVCAIAWRYLE